MDDTRKPGGQTSLSSVAKPLCSENTGLGQVRRLGLVGLGQLQDLPVFSLGICRWGGGISGRGFFLKSPPPPPRSEKSWVGDFLMVLQVFERRRGFFASQTRFTFRKCNFRVEN